MKKSPSAAHPEAYVAALSGWRLKLVSALRRAANSAPTLTEEIKWRHLVYSAIGPTLLIRAEETRVLFGFWRGKRLQEIEPRLRPSGQYEMATLELLEGMTIASETARRLVREAARLNEELGDPRWDVKRRTPSKGKSAAKKPEAARRPTTAPTRKVVSRKR